MRFWIREFLGWVFMLLGLLLLAGCVLLAVTENYVQGSVIAFVGFIIFRAGIHFLKVAVAARIYMNTHQSVADARSNNQPLSDASQKRPPHASSKRR